MRGGSPEVTPAACLSVLGSLSPCDHSLAPLWLPDLLKQCGGPLTGCLFLPNVQDSEVRLLCLCTWETCLLLLVTRAQGRGTGGGSNFTGGRVLPRIPRIPYPDECLIADAEAVVRVRSISNNHGGNSNSP